MTFGTYSDAPAFGVEAPGRERIALCLSGGGYRAALFHLGVLRRLNEYGLLPCIDTVSAVSGGSLAAAALANAWDALIVDDHGVLEGFEELVAWPLERLVTERPNLRIRWWHRLGRRNRAKARRGEYDRTDRFAQTLDRRMFHGRLLEQTPIEPNFLFGSTNLRTGARWESQRSGMGDALLGSTLDHGLTLAEVVAASAADPLELPALAVRFDPTTFEGGAFGPSEERQREAAALADGSLRDPLAIEGCLDAHRMLICCDAGQAFDFTPKYDEWMGNRLLRSFASVCGQAGASQRRWLSDAFATGAYEGCYVGLNDHHESYRLEGSVGYAPEVVERIGRIPAGLRRFDGAEASALVNHGYTMIDCALRRHLAAQLTVSVPLQVPDPELMERNRVLRLLVPDDATSVARAA